MLGDDGKGSKSSANSIGNRDIAVPAQSVPAEQTTTTLSSSSTSVRPDAGSSITESTTRSGGRVVAITDAAGDIGSGGPGYADAVEVTIDDEGANARIRVRMNAGVPLTLADREVIGVGVNIDDAQVFADGESDGWYAYLQLGERFVNYPGTFEISGDTLIFSVPWNVLGDPRQGSVDAFVDWSKPKLVGLQADSSADRGPDTGGVTFAR